MRKNLLDVVGERPVVGDGGMGTMLARYGIRPGECGERWNLDKPDVIEKIHAAYRSAGCELMTTNTFGGCAATLERHGLSGDVEVLNRAAAELARRAVDDDAWVIGDIGPFGGFLEPLGETTADELRAMFAAQAKALLAGGVDAIVVETMTDPNEAAIGVSAAKDAGAPLVIGTFAFDKAGDAFRTMMGTTVEQALATVKEAGAGVVGANCGTSLDLDDYRKLAAELVAAAAGTPVILQPNAGAPIPSGDDVTYPATPDDMANLAADLVGLGVRMVGGCCGTNPDHLAAMAAAVKA